MDTKQKDLSELSIEQLIANGFSIDEIKHIANIEKLRQEADEEKELQAIRENVASSIVDYVIILTKDTPTKEERIELEDIIVQSFKKAEAQLKEFSKLKEVSANKSDEEQIRNFVEGLKRKSSFIW